MSLLECCVSVIAVLDEFHHLAEVYELVADDLVIFVQSKLSNIAVGHLEVAGTLLQSTVHCTDLGTETLTEVLKACADRKTVLRESGLGSAVNDLEEQLSHCCVDSVANEVGVESLKNGSAGEDLSCHSSRVSHTRAADGLNERLLDNAALYVEGQLAGTLLGCAPADTVCEAVDVGDLLSLYPLCFFGDRRSAVCNALCYGTHVFNFMRISHCCLNSFQHFVRRSLPGHTTVLYNISRHFAIG